MFWLFIKLSNNTLSKMLSLIQLWLPSKQVYASSTLLIHNITESKRSYIIYWRSTASNQIMIRLEFVWILRLTSNHNMLTSYIFKVNKCVFLWFFFFSPTGWRAIIVCILESLYTIRVTVRQCCACACLHICISPSLAEPTYYSRQGKAIVTVGAMSALERQ